MPHIISPCVECDRLAIDYEQTLADHADFVAEHEAAVRANQDGKSWELKMAVRGSELSCQRAKERLAAHRAEHREDHAA